MLIEGKLVPEDFFLTVSFLPVAFFSFPLNEISETLLDELEVIESSESSESSLVNLDDVNTLRTTLLLPV